MRLLIPTRLNIVSLGVVAMLIVMTAAFPVTNGAVRQISIVTQYSALAIAVVCGVLAVAQGTLLQSSIFALIGFFAMFTYGLLMAAVHGGIASALSDVPTTMLLVPLALILMGQRDIVIRRPEALALLGYVLIFLLLTVLLGGLVLDMPPRFQFELLSARHGSEVLYGQGVTKFFGIGAIIAVYLLDSTERPMGKLAMAGLALTFLGLSFLGGARGDSLGIVITLILIYLRRSPFMILISFIILATLVYYLIDYFAQNYGVVLFARVMNLLDGNIGIRSWLYSVSLDMIYDDLHCTLIGCGFNYFQHSLALEENMYPHNFILESIITWGAPISIFYLSFALIGLYGAYKSRDGFDMFIMISIYFMVIYLKSGSILSGWLFAAGVFHFFGRGLVEIGNLAPDMPTVRRMRPTSAELRGVHD